MKIRPVIFGATGMVGEGVLHETLNHDDVEAVLSISRRKCDISHPKLTELIHDDFFDYTRIVDKLQGWDACFFCLGVTSLGRNEAEYRRLTYDLTLAAARALAGANPGMTFCYVSGAGTDSTEQGRLMWARVKGKTENDLMKLPFNRVTAFRPGFIRPTPGLRNSFLAARVVSPLYPVLKKFFPAYVCTLEEVGLSMIAASRDGTLPQIMECRDITEYGRKEKSR
jgi:uncharacterized protein YbjT (DUF2867 family)